MGVERNQNFIIGALVVASLGLLFHIIGFASPYWYSEDNSGIKTNAGLWKLCIEQSGVSACTDVKGDNAESYHKAAQAMGILAVLCGVGAIVVLVLKQFVMKDSPAMNFGYYIAIGLLAVTALFIVIEFAVWVDKQSTQVKENLSWAFGLDVTGMILFIIAAVLIGIPSS